MDQTNHLLDAQGDQVDDFVTGFDDYEADEYDDAETTDDAEADDPDEGTEDEAEEPEEDTDESGDSDGEETEGQEEPPAMETPETIRVKYNGQELDIPYGEAQALVQKGMNYDRVVEQRDKAKNDPGLMALNDFANEFGISTEEAVNRLIAVHDQDAVDELVENGMAEDMAQQTVAKNRELARLKAEKQAREIAAREETERLKPWDELVRVFPEVGAEGFTYPDEFVELVAQGYSPLQAYTLVDKQKAARSQVAAKQNRTVKKKSPGPAKGTAKKEAPDPFLEGFFGR